MVLSFECTLTTPGGSDFTGGQLEQQSFEQKQRHRLPRGHNSAHTERRNKCMHAKTCKLAALVGSSLRPLVAVSTFSAKQESDRLTLAESRGGLKTEDK